MTMICKKCKKAFRKDLRDFDETDQFCPHCDNEFFIPAATGNVHHASQESLTQEDANENGDEKSLLESRVSKISHLDPRMIRDEDLDALDEELLGFEPDMTSRLG